MTTPMLTLSLASFPPFLSRLFFFFNDTATTEIYTLSLHDALPISLARPQAMACRRADWRARLQAAIRRADPEDRKSTRLNSSHVAISYAVFCLKKKKRRHTEAPGLRLQKPERSRGA